MIVKKAGGRVYGAAFNSTEKRAMDIEIKRQLAEYTRKHATEVDAVFLWYMHEEFGYGRKRLRRIHDGIIPKLKELCERLQMTDKGDDVWLCTYLLKGIGVDLEEWEKERGD